MKKYTKELVILILQLLLFYVFPLSAGPTDAMGMVFLIICGTFLLSVLMGILSQSDLKYLYPGVVAVAFLPSVFIYYNESAIIHAVWYLFISAAGLGLAAMVSGIFRLFKK